MTATAATIPLGRVVMTRGVASLMERHPWIVAALREWLPKHRRGECHHLDEHDRQANAAAISDGERVFTSWQTGLEAEPTVWIVTEADRSSTCVLLPSEY